MKEIEEQLNSLSSHDVPIGIHQSVMQKINYQKFQPVLIVSFFLLVINFILIIWHINAKLIDAEFADMMQDFFEIFNFNFSFINTLVLSFFEIISPLLLISAVLSLVGSIYTGRKISFWYFSRA